MLKRLGFVILIAVQISCTSTTTTTTESIKPDPADVANRKANVLIKLGMAYSERGQQEVAMQQYNKALKVYPQSYDAHTVIANLYEQIDQPELAQQHYEEAIDLAPDNPSTLNNYGKYLCNNGDYQQAEKYFTRAASTPFYSRPWLPLTNAGLCMTKADHFEKAEINFRAALEKHPTYAPALMAMAQLGYQQQKYPTARAFLQRYEALLKLTAEQLLLAVQIEQALGDSTTAAQYAQQLRTQFPQSPQPGHIVAPEALGVVRE
jgi:type IV pilus assembly protein PilF